MDGMDACGRLQAMTIVRRSFISTPSELFFAASPTVSIEACKFPELKNTMIHRVHRNCGLCADSDSALVALRTTIYDIDAPAEVDDDDDDETYIG